MHVLAHETRLLVIRVDSFNFRIFQHFKQGDWVTAHEMYIHLCDIREGDIGLNTSYLLLDTATHQVWSAQKEYMLPGFKGLGVIEARADVMLAPYQQVLAILDAVPDEKLPLLLAYMQTESRSALQALIEHRLGEDA